MNTRDEQGKPEECSASLGQAPALSSCNVAGGLAGGGAGRVGLRVGTALHFIPGQVSIHAMLTLSASG